MDDSTASSLDRSSNILCRNWIVRSWKVRPSFAFSLAVGIIAFLLTSSSTGDQLFGIAVGVGSALFSLWIIALFRSSSYSLLLAIGSGVIAAWIVFVVTDWYLFATLVGLMAFAVSRSVIVLYQRRAKVSLLFIACILPAMVAVVCWGWLQLSPFRQRSMAFDVAKSSNLFLSTRLSNQTGEWIVEGGTYVPSWLAKLAGDHATTRIQGLMGKLEDFQSPAVCALNLEDLSSAWIVKSVDSPEFSTELCDWLRSCQKLSLVNLDFTNISEMELVLIERLSQSNSIKSIEVRLNLNRCDDQVDLSRLPRGMLVRVSGDQLTVSRASQLSGMKSLTVETQTISAEAVSRLTGIHRLWLVGCTFDDESAKAINEVSAYSLVLDGCVLPNDFEIQTAQSCKRHVARLDLFNTQIQPNMLVPWLIAAEVTCVSLPRPSDNATEEKLTKQLSNIPSLEFADFVRTINAQGQRRYETLQLKR